MTKTQTCAASVTMSRIAGSYYTPARAGGCHYIADFRRASARYRTRQAGNLASPVACGLAPALHPRSRLWQRRVPARRPTLSSQTPCGDQGARKFPGIPSMESTWIPLRWIAAGRALPAADIHCGNALLGPEFPANDVGGEALAPFRGPCLDWRRTFPDACRGGWLRCRAHAIRRGFRWQAGSPARMPREIVAYLTRRFGGSTYLPNLFEYFVALSLDWTRPAAASAWSCRTGWPSTGSTPGCASGCCAKRA